MDTSNIVQISQKPYHHHHTITNKTIFILIITIIIILSTKTSASNLNFNNNANNDTKYLEDINNNNNNNNKEVNNENNDNNPTTTARTTIRVTTTFSTSVEEDNQIPNNSKQQLPLEKLFSQIITPNPNPNYYNNDNNNNTNIESNNRNYNNNERELNTELSSRLLNHSILHGSDDELDRLVFSQLPEGSKLVLRTIQIVKTDENGNEETMGDPAVTWDVVPINSTIGEESDEEINDDDEINDEENDDDDEEEKQNDLEQAGSHPKTLSSAYTSSDGSNEKTKIKKDKYFHGHDHGKEHKLTNTDTDGKKVTNYKGTEKGLNDFVKSHGNSQSNEGERYKNSKKKNKGRKVTGFKRVYHKEEFQRTEHFYDDEEAKKIAESYGLSDSNEKSKHGVKNDDDKYHGTRIEKTNEEKIKNEHSTKNGHHKGQKTTYKDTDEHKHNQNYRTSSQQNPQNNNNNNNNNNYPQHNYQGAYSHSKSTPHVGIRTHGQQTQDHSRPYNLRSIEPIEIESKPISLSKFPLTMPTGGDESQFDTMRTMHPPKPPTNKQQQQQHLRSPVFIKKPNEMKIFFADRERRNKPSGGEPTNINYYAPNFGPDTLGSENIEGYPENHGHNNNEVSEFYNKMGNVNSNSSSSSSSSDNIDVIKLIGKTNTKNNNRYADEYTKIIIPSSLPPPLFDAIPEYYSTILKMNINPSSSSSSGSSGSYVPYINYKSNSNLISIEKAKAIEPVIETVPQHSRPESIFLGNRYTNWVPIGNIDDSDSSSNTENTIVRIKPKPTTTATTDKNNITHLDSTETIINEVVLNSTTDDPAKELIPKYMDNEKYQKDLPEFINIGRPQGYVGQQQRSRPYNVPFHHSLGPGPHPIMRGKGHYYGRTIGTNTNLRPGPGPGLHTPNFMDGLMNSVSDFFNKIGK